MVMCGPHFRTALSRGANRKSLKLSPLKKWQKNLEMFPSTLKSCLTVKAPNKNCSRRHFNFLLLSFKGTKV